MPCEYTEKVVRNIGQQAVLHDVKLLFDVGQVQDIIFHCQLHKLEKQQLRSGGVVQLRQLRFYPGLQLAGILDEDQLLRRHVEKQADLRQPRLVLVRDAQRTPDVVAIGFRLAVTDGAEAAEHLLVMREALLHGAEFIRRDELKKRASLAVLHGSESSVCVIVYIFGHLRFSILKCFCHIIRPVCRFCNKRVESLEN